MKVLLDSTQLISHMLEKGITFRELDEESAKNFLERNNYYLKLASYRFNYQKGTGTENQGKYINLDFAYLKELSTIDMHLRYLVLEMSLDIEHFLKVRLLNEIENNEAEDGYQIIQKFISENEFPEKGKVPRYILKNIAKHKSSDYCKGLIEKYFPYFPAWVFVELISFGDLAYLCEFYRKTYGVVIGDRILLNSVRDIRNASAHSNCLINNLHPGNNTYHNSVMMRVKEIENIGHDARKKKLSNKCIYDFVCLLYAYDSIITSEQTKNKRYEELNNFFNGRMIRHKEWFYDNSLITSSYCFVKSVIDKITGM